MSNKRQWWCRCPEASSDWIPVGASTAKLAALRFAELTGMADDTRVEVKRDREDKVTTFLVTVEVSYTYVAKETP